jgi:hypothetical protein
MLLGLFSPGFNSHPALAHLRHELEAARHPHLVFVNPPIPPLPAPYAALVSPVDSTQPESTGAGPADQPAPNHGILATATVLRGNTPLAEGMHVPLIRFALTPPAAPGVGQAGMLPQVWDDGPSRLPTCSDAHHSPNETGYQWCCCWRCWVYYRRSCSGGSSEPSTLHNRRKPTTDVTHLMRHC